MGPWEEQRKILEEGGYSQEAIFEHEQTTRKLLFVGGYSGDKIDEFFGIKKFDSKPIKSYFDTNLAQFEHQRKIASEEAKDPLRTTIGQQAPDAMAEEADTFLEALEAGFQMSVSGLVGRGKAPDLMVSEDSGMFYRIVSQIGTLVGDVPAMIAGGIGGGAAGGAAGAAVGGPAAPATAAVGSMLGSSAGAFALPAGMRQILMDHYEKGDVKDFGDFWERASAAFIESGKAGLVGAATAGVGGAVGKVLTPVSSTLAKGASASTTAFVSGANPALHSMSQSSMKMLSEAATMVTVGKALEGEVPSVQEFLEAGIVIGGMHGAPKVAKTLRNIYAKTNVKPGEAVIKMEADPTLKQEVLSEFPNEVKIQEKLSGVEKAPELAPELSPETPLQPPKEPPKTEFLPPEKPVEPGKTELVSDPADIAAARKILQDNTGTQGKKLKASMNFREFYRNFVDRLDPINQVVKQFVKDAGYVLDAENPYTLARMANDYKAKVKYLVEAGTIDFATLAKNGKGFNEIVKPVKERLGDLDLYMQGRRHLELEGRGIVSATPEVLAQSRKFVEHFKPEFEAVAMEITEFSNRNLKYLRDSGRISLEQYENFVEMNKDYIPFRRLLEGNEQMGGKGEAGFLKGIRDSEAKIQSPLLSMLENAEGLMKMAERNRAQKALVDFYLKNEYGPQGPDGTGSSGLLEKVEAKTRVIEISEAEIAAQFKKMGIEATPEAMNFYRKEGKVNLAENEFLIYRDGKREIWATKDPVLAKAVKVLDGDVTSQNVLMTLFRGFTAVKKIGITMTPEFIAKNFIRDQVTAMIYSKYGRVGVFDTIVAMGDFVKQTPAYHNWLKSGGAGGAFMELGTYLKGDILKLQEQTGFRDTARNIISKPKQWMELAALVTESATRLAEFKRVSKGAESGPKIFEAGMASREVTLDFQRIGAQMSALNAITAFQNVSIQGLDRAVRAGKMAWDNPGTYGAGALKATSLLTTASVTLWAINHDEQWYKEINRWEKDLFWHMKVGDTIFRLPKPQELGILFGSLPERVLEKFLTDNPRAMNDFGDTMMGLITPSYVPDAIQPPIEQMLNRSFFTSNPIVSRSIEKLLPGAQYTEYTSETAKGIGKLIGTLPVIKDIGPKDAKLASPVVVENYVRGWTGTLGMYILQGLDKSLTTTGVVKDLKPESTMADWPFIKAFVTRYPSAGTQSIHDFRDNFDQTTKVWNTFKIMIKRGQGDEIGDFLAEHQEDMVRLTGINEGMTNINHAIQMVQQSTEFSKSDKRQLIDTLYFQMSSMAKSGNDLSHSVRKSLKRGN